MRGELTGPCIILIILYLENAIKKPNFFLRHRPEERRNGLKVPYLNETSLFILHFLFLVGFQFQLERQWAPLSVTTQSPLGFMLAKSISLLEWVPRTPWAAVPVICICHLLFSLTLLLPLYLLSPSDGTSYRHFLYLSLSLCSWSVFSSLPPSPFLSLSLSILSLPIQIVNFIKYNFFFYL